MSNDQLNIWETISTGQGDSIVAHVSRSDIDRGVQDALWVCDGNTRSFLPDTVDPSRCVVVPPGETSKDWPQVASILDAAVSLGLDRGGTIVAFGGGVICDLAAFAASVYLRGIRTVLIPTSLLAIVDAAVGGKTGINYGGYKNMIGTFHT
ncbi:MAG: 3-dehydroquinate synthase, partial [Spirochaetota bacterium]